MNNPANTFFLTGKEWKGIDLNSCLQDNCINAAISGERL
jgi:hypothetical protein